MPLTLGTRLGAYEILTLIGSGGMGEVYRAKDTKLRRDVALKILPEAFAADPDRIARFQREAELLATLNHPHIAAVYGIEESSGTTAIILELVEGETLADRIARGPLDLEDALAIARQLVEALEVAHDRGVIHRDLKPANIKITPEGKVKVLDFGLAKMAEREAAVSGLSMSPTLSVQATYAGVILGTAAYMSPEQARGKPVDRKTDIWAFGCVLYEVLTGRQAFDAGDTVSDAVAAILRADVHWDALPATTPPVLLKLLRRCLQKDPQKRLPHIGLVRIELDEAARDEVPPGSATARAGLRRRITLLVTITALVAATLGGLAAMLMRTRNAQVLPSTVVDIATGATNEPTSFALSPDGRELTFVAAGPEGYQLWLRRLDSAVSTPLVGTEGALYPFWSPDSRSIAFFANTKLKRLDIDGGGVQSIASVITPAGGTWNEAGLILFVPNSAAGLYTVTAAGGRAAPLARPEPGRRTVQRFPQFLPDGRHFIYYTPGVGDASGIFVDDIDHHSPDRITASDAGAVYGSGHLFFVRQGAIVAQPFDLKTLTLSGPLVRVADAVTIGGLQNAAMSVAANGSILFRLGTGRGRRRLLWFDRAGHDLGPAADEVVLPASPTLSPDGRTIAFQDRRMSNNTDIWLTDVARRTSTRFTYDPAIDALPIWSPDGKRLVFNSSRTGGSALYVQALDAKEPQLVLAARPDEVQTASDWSPDGRFVLYRHLDFSTGLYDLYALEIDGRRTPVPVVATPYDDRDGQFSPDGNWLAYQSDESGHPEIYVQPFGRAGRKQRVSTGSGTQVRWRRDGRELFYVDASNRLTAVQVTPAPDGQLTFGSPVVLFETRLLGTFGVSRQQYVVTNDGQRFLLVNVDEDTTSPPLTLVLNWKPHPQ